jgi:hypothetical protein
MPEVLIEELVEIGVLLGALWSSNPSSNIAEVVIVQTLLMHSKPNRRVKQDGKAALLYLLPH